MVLRLRDYAPWRELTRSQAVEQPPERILTVVHGDGDDCELAGIAGVRWVNALSFWLASKPLPADLLVEDVWFDEHGWPVLGDE